jgi:hypothetical protein
VAEGDVEPLVRADDAQAVRPHQADAVAPGELRDVFLEPQTLRARFAKARREDQHHAHAVLAAVFDDGRDSGGGRGHDREIHVLADVVERGVGLAALDLLALRIDRMDAALVVRVDEVAQHDAADGVRPVAGAEQGHALRGEQGCQIMCAHARTLTHVNLPFLNFCTGA